MTVETLPTLLTEMQLADYLGVHPETVARERRRGRLPWHQIGGLIRFTPGDVQEYLDRCATTSAPAAASGTSAGPSTACPDVSALALEIAGKRKLPSRVTS